MTTGRPPAPVPPEPIDPAARASLELPSLFQPHVDLEKTSGGGASAEGTSVPSNVNSVSQSQDSEVTVYEAITAEEPFRGYSFEVSLFFLPLTSDGLCRVPLEMVPSVPPLLFLRGLSVSKVTIFGVLVLTYHHPLPLLDIGHVGTTVLRLCE